MTILPLRSLLLAAGFGTRLRPITASKPKCLVDVGGKPLLENWLLKLENLSCEKTIINTHYLSAQVDSFLEFRSKSSMDVVTSHESELLGTARTLINSRSLLRFSRTLLAHADNATSDSLEGLLQAHQSRPSHCLMTMMTFDTDSPRSCGIVQTDSNKVVVRFHEKSENPPGNCANSAVYVFDPPFWEFLDSSGIEFFDFSTDVIPLLVGRIYTYHTINPFFDIGTPENLEKALNLWPNSVDSYNA